MILFSLAGRAVFDQKAFLCFGKEFHLFFLLVDMNKEARRRGSSDHPAKILGWAGSPVGTAKIFVGSKGAPSASSL